VDFLKELNAPQRAAAEHLDGPMMVIAGAGSGKTRVLTFRIAYLMSKGVDAYSILALTFTNKAAREMKLRIGKLVGEDEARNLWMGTFHSIFARILRVESDRINYPNNFTIYDSQDSRALLKDIIKGMNLDDKVYKVAAVANRISGAKNNLIDAEGYFHHSEIQAEDKLSGKPLIGQIFKSYENRCFRSSAMDFDDLLYKMNVLLRDNPDLLIKYQQRFQYIMVDEYQDTNYAQYLIIKQLAAAHENVCVVGDDAQSIYGFRGASIQNILNFRKDYPNTVTHKLEQNYRSTKVIVKAANSVIAVNKDQIKKEVWTENDEGDKIQVHCAIRDNNEGQYVADHIFELRGRSQCEYSDFAILYRTNAQSRSFEESLRKLNIPYRIYGGQSFYQRKEIKDLIAYFRLTVNNRDDEALRRIINYPARGIGATTLDRLFVAAAEQQIGVFDLLTVGVQPATLKGAAWKKVQDFVIMMQSFATELETKSAHSLALNIAKRSGIVHQLYTEKQKDGNYNEGTERYENVQELLNGIHAFSDENEENNGSDTILTLRDYLSENIELLTDADNEEDDNNKVSLMTIHAAKGLEFKHVHVVGMEENLFPSQRSMDSRADMEEERRLFYVAITRACETCTLSYATMRFKWGQLHMGEPSRFIDEIDEQYLLHSAKGKEPKKAYGSGGGFSSGGWAAKTSTRPSAKPKPKLQERAQSDYKPSIGGRKLKKVNLSKVATSEVSNSATATSDFNPSNLAEGMSVGHAKFGKGTVIKIEGESPNVKATIKFPAVGTKQLLLKFAKLDILS
jgi:DNA helicase-2/ATP-dependent DNA helicase PcrA